MTRDPYRFRINRETPFDEAELSLHLAVIAASGLFGESRVRMDASYRVEAGSREITVDAGNEVGSAVVRMFTAFLTREFGEAAFSVRRAEPQTTQRQPACSAA